LNKEKRNNGKRRKEKGERRKEKGTSPSLNETRN